MLVFKNWIHFQENKKDVTQQLHRPRTVCRVGAGRSSLYLENGGIYFLVIILFARVLPRDPEHGLLIIFPNQPWVHVAVNLLNQPLPEPPASIPVTHPWEEKSIFYDTTSIVSLITVLNCQETLIGKAEGCNTGANLGETHRSRNPGPPAMRRQCLSPGPQILE